jgi:hypothetical protein
MGGRAVGWRAEPPIYMESGTDCSGSDDRLGGERDDDDEDETDELLIHEW